MAKNKTSGKYAAQENYADKMAHKDCIRITVWVHESKAAAFKKKARQSCTA